MEFTLCNEVLGDVPFPEQCRIAAELGYAGLEIAPFTLAPDPTRITDRQIAEFRRIVEDHGLHVTGLHWLMVAPEGLSITDPDPVIKVPTADALAAIVDLCAGLGGRVLVHGSPRQRVPGPDPARSRATAIDHLSRAGARARAAGLTYCLEPLSPDESGFINTVAEATALVSEAAEPGLRTMIDTGHALRGETLALADLGDRWLPTGMIAHIQVNDSNRRGPGQGPDKLGPFLRRLMAHCWRHPVAVEPFDYRPDGPTTAARSIGYLHGLTEAASVEANGRS